MRIQFYITSNKLFSQNDCSEQYIFDCRVSMLMRKSVLILAIAPLVFLIAACGGESA